MTFLTTATVGLLITVATLLCAPSHSSAEVIRCHQDQQLSIGLSKAVNILIEAVRSSSTGIINCRWKIELSKPVQVLEPIRLIFDPTAEQIESWEIVQDKWRLLRVKLRTDPNADAISLTEPFPEMITLNSHQSSIELEATIDAKVLSGSCSLSLKVFILKNDSCGHWVPHEYSCFTVRPYWNRKKIEVATGVQCDIEPAYFDSRVSLASFVSKMWNRQDEKFNLNDRTLLGITGCPGNTSVYSDCTADSRYKCAWRLFNGDSPLIESSKPINQEPLSLGNQCVFLRVTSQGNASISKASCPTNESESNALLAVHRFSTMCGCDMESVEEACASFNARRLAKDTRATGDFWGVVKISLFIIVISVSIFSVTKLFYLFGYWIVQTFF